VPNVLPNYHPTQMPRRQPRGFAPADSTRSSQHSRVSLHQIFYACPGRISFRFAVWRTASDCLIRCIPKRRLRSSLSISRWKATAHSGESPTLIVWRAPR